MSRNLTPRWFAPIAAIGFIVVISTLAVVRSPRGEDGVNMAPTGGEVANPRASELTLCRTVTLEQIARLANCRRVWAENRRRFVRPTKTPPASADVGPTATISSEKDRHQVSPGGVEHPQSEGR